MQIIVWSEDSSQTKAALYSAIEKLSFDVEILLKIEVGDQVGGKNWQRFGGSVSTSRLVEVIQNNEDFVFGHGLHQLCIRDKNSGDYLAFDEHGILFIYSDADCWRQMLAIIGFQERREEPLFGVPHFHHTPPDPEKLEAKFVSELNLQLLDCDV